MPQMQSMQQMQSMPQMQPMQQMQPMMGMVPNSMCNMQPMHFNPQAQMALCGPNMGMQPMNSAQQMHAMSGQMPINGMYTDGHMQSMGSMAYPPVQPRRGRPRRRAHHVSTYYEDEEDVSFYDSPSPRRAYEEQFARNACGNCSPRNHGHGKRHSSLRANRTRFLEPLDEAFRDWRRDDNCSDSDDDDWWIAPPARRSQRSLAPHPFY
eukprot:GEMP01041933.1.p1 GENE.GEMP01041933.1~~GEMP01041933.1.p1  ORF type:complete len:208 (+),score=48.04 GEMP01041933.1:3-626(+)